MSVNVLRYSSYMADVMSNSLSDLLDGKRINIPLNVLNDAKRVFFVGADYARKKNMENIASSVYCGSEELIATYVLLKDVLQGTGKVAEKDIDSELEKLAVAMEVLTPDGRQIILAKDTYQTLSDMFKEMHTRAEDRFTFCHIGDDSDE